MLGDLTRFSKAESLVGPLRRVQHFKCVALDGYAPQESEQSEARLARSESYR